MWIRTLLLASAVSLLPANPAAVEGAVSCEDICADLAAARCERINSVKCSFYIAGCLSGCSLGKIVRLVPG